MAKGSIFLFLLLLLIKPSFADEHWIEEVVLDDGTIIEVNRSVEFHHGTSTLSEALRKYPSLYYLEFKHPKLPIKIEWKGIREINPIALQVIGNFPYLAVFTNAGASTIHDKPELYGCPEVPFSFLKYDLGKSLWLPIPPMEAPNALLNANLTAYYRSDLMTPGKLNRERVAELVRYQSLSGYFQSKIPRNADEWNYRSKKTFLTSRVKNDCRPPLEKIVDAIFPRKDDRTYAVEFRKADFEILDDKVLDPPLMVPDKQRSTMLLDEQSVKKCLSYFTDPDKNDMRLVGYKGFVDDLDKKKYTAHWGNWVFCGDDFNYVANYIAERNRVVLAKYNRAGDVLNYLSIPRPSGRSYPLATTTQVRDGYLYFDFGEEGWKDGFRGKVYTRFLSVRVKEN